MAFPATRKTVSRLIAIQVLYGRDIAVDKLDPARQVLNVLEAYDNKEMGEEEFAPDRKFVLKLVTGTNSMLEKLDTCITVHLSAGWDMEKLGAVMRALLRTGVYELTISTDVPAKVVISEYVTLARSFFTEAETGFVNGILDKISREVRHEKLEAGVDTIEG